MILLSIQTDFNKAVVWMVSPHPIISTSSNPCSYPVVTVPRAPIRNSYDSNFLNRKLFFFPNYLAISRYLHIKLSFNFTLWSASAKSITKQVLFLFFTTTRSVHLAEIRSSVYTSMSQKSLAVSFSRTDSLFRRCHLFVWSDLNFLHKFQQITLPT